MYPGRFILCSLFGLTLGIGTVVADRAVAFAEPSPGPGTRSLSGAVWARLPDFVLTLDHQIVATPQKEKPKPPKDQHELCRNASPALIRMPRARIGLALAFLLGITVGWFLARRL